MKEILKYSIWTGICAVLFIPFIVANSMFFPYITGKAFAFRIIVEIILGLWLILIIKDKEFRPKWSWVLGAVGIFTLILLIADINAVAPYKAFWSNFERMEGWVTFAHLGLYFLVLGSMLNKENLWLWFLRLNIGAGTIMAISSIDNATEARFSGPLGNPIYISVYFLFIFFFTVILLYKDVLIKNLMEWRAFKKVFSNALFYIYSGVAILSLYVVYRTSRGALLGAIGGIFVAAIFIALFEKEKKLIKQIALGGIAMVIAVVIVFFSVKDTAYVKNNPTLSRFAEISWSNTNGNARQMIWPMALKGFKEKPILGWGQEGFNYVFNKYYDPKMYAQEAWFDRAHNAPLDFLVAGGILGLISYLFLFGSALYLLWFRRNNLDFTERALLSGLFIGYLFQAIFVFDNLISYIMFFATLAYVHSRTAEEIPESENNKKYLKNNIKQTKEEESYLAAIISNEEYQNYILIPLVIILTAFGVWWVNIPGIMSNQTLIQALRQIQTGQINQGMDTFNLALSYKSIGDSEIREQLISYAPYIISMNELDQKTKFDFFNFAINEVKKQINIVPDDARYYIILGTLLNGSGNSEQALIPIKRAIELSPQKQAMRFELMKALYSLGRSEEAMLEAKSAYELEKNYDQAKNFYIEMIRNHMAVKPAFKPEGDKILNELGVK